MGLAGLVWLSVWFGSSGVAGLVCLVMLVWWFQSGVSGLFWSVGWCGLVGPLWCGCAGLVGQVWFSSGLIWSDWPVLVWLVCSD